MKCLDSSSAILVKSEKKAGGREGFVGPKRAIMSHLRQVQSHEPRNH